MMFKIYSRLGSLGQMRLTSIPKKGEIIHINNYKIKVTSWTFDEATEDYRVYGDIIS